MPKFCIHEQHAGICEKTGSYCNEGACPYEDIRDFAEVVHGRWIPTLYPFMAECEDCSNCGYRTVYGNDYPYCPNCGAKMDEEETNELDKR